VVLQGLRALVLDVNAEVFGVPATVQIPNGPPVETTIIWLDPTTEQAPGQGELRRAEQHKACAIKRSDLPAVPRGTVITIFEGGINYRWKVDSSVALPSDRHHVLVVPMDPAP
jgi:hypothetical protein